MTWDLLSPNGSAVKVGVERWDIVEAYLRLGWTVLDESRDATTEEKQAYLISKTAAEML